MVDKNEMFGFELLQSLYDTQIVKKEDVIILFVHWYFLKNGFRCIGLGDSKAYSTSEKGSELLPEGWSTNPSYALRYVNDQKLYILHGVKSDEDLLLNLLRTNDQSVSNAQFPINATISNLRGPLKSLMPSYQNVLQTIQTNLIDTILPPKSAETSTQTATVNKEQRVSRETDPFRVPSTHPVSATGPRPDTDLRNVGSADLNPLAQGSGMIFDPFTPTRHNPHNPYGPALGVPGVLPPRSVPPYARFDPFGPPDIDRPRPRQGPDNDHLPPPGYDDMFM